MINTVVGNGTATFAGDGGQALSASLNQPNGVAFDSAGDMYISDTINCRIRKVDTLGIISTIAGTGSCTYTGDGVAATTAAINYPKGIAINAAGDVFFADSHNNRIRKVDHTTNLLETVAGNGTANFSGDGGLATAAELNTPTDVAVDAAGNLYIADSSNNRIREVDATTGFISTIAGTGSAGFSGDGGLATAASLYFPQALTLDSSGNVVISDTENSRVRRIDHFTGHIATIAGNGGTTFSGDGGPAYTASVYWPYGIVYDAAGNLYICDYNSVIRKVDTNGIITTIAGSPYVYSYSGDGVPATSATFGFPDYLAVYGQGLYVADSPANRIRAITPFPPVVTSLGSEAVNQTSTATTVGFNSITGTAASYSLAYGTDFAVNSGSCSGGANYGSCPVTFTPQYPGLRRDALLAKDVNGNIIGTEYVYGIGQGPLGVVTPGLISTVNLSSLGSSALLGTALDPAGNLYIADAINNRIIKVDTSGNASVVTITGETLIGPYGLAVDGAGNLDIVDSSNLRIVQVSPSGAATAITPSVSVIGISGIAIGPDGTLYLASSLGGQVIKISPSGVSSVLSLSTTLMLPTGLAFDTAGNLYISDQGLHEIVVLPAGGTDHVLTTSVTFPHPEFLSTDAAGNLYVTDASLHQVFRVDSTGTATVIAGNGTAGDTGDGGIATDAELSAPVSVSVAPDGTIYLTDSQTLRKISANSLALPDTNVGATANETTAVNNIGNLPYTLNGSFTFGQNPSEFSLINTGSGDCAALAGSSLAAAASCNVEVQFAPTAGSTYTDTLTLAAGLQISVNGTGLGTSLSGNPLSLSTGTLNFGSQLMGVAGNAQTFTLTNNGGAAVTLSTFVVTGTNSSDFAVTSSCASTLAAGANCTVSVVFSPSMMGSESANLTFTDMLGGNTYSQTVALSGVGAGTSVTGPIVPSSTGLSVPSLFVAGSGSVRTITLTNTGVNAVTLNNFTLSGTNAADFTVTSGCGTSLTANATCTLSIVFQPTVTGNESATLTLTYLDSVSGISYTQDVLLSGAGLSGLPTGTVEILNRNSGKALDVLNLSTANGATIQQYDYLGGANQQWQFVPDGAGYYSIVNANSGKVLDDTGYSTQNGTLIQQWAPTGADNQKWTVTQMSDGSFTITNKLSGKLLDVTGLSKDDMALIQQWDATGGSNQRWSIIAAQQYFTITNKLSGKVLDVTGYSRTDGTTIQQWDSLGGENQEWQFVSLGNGYYQILNHESGKVLDATDPTGTVGDGTLIQQWDYLGGLNQQWQLIPLGNGYFEVANRANGMVLDVTGLSTANGAHIQLWTYLGGANQQWTITAVH